MFGFNKKDKSLEMILLSLHANAENNYKDNAQANYKEFLKKFEELKTAGKLKPKQIAYYEQQCEELAKMMKNYTHFDQRADFKGVGELKMKK